MIKKMTCIECPKGCQLTVTVEDERVIGVAGNQCPKGQAYAHAEVECPVRVITSTVRTNGLSLRMVPVRTDKAVPKKELFRVMDLVRDTVINAPVTVGDCVVENMLGLGVNLIATRSAS